MKKNLLIAILLCPLLVSAQYGSNHISTIGVKSLRVGGKYTKQQVIAAMGVQPTSYRTFPNDYDIGINESYMFGENRLRFVEGGILAGFVIESPQYPVFEQYNGGIRVGDPIIKLNQLNIPYSVLKPSGTGKYEFSGGDDRVNFYVDSNGLITKIAYSFPT